MNIVIKELSDSGVTWEQLTTLLHDSFQERLDQGLRFTCSFMSAEQYAAKTKNGIVLVAIDNNTNELLGTSTITLKRDKDNFIFGYGEYLAISPKAKRQGIATLLEEEQSSLIINRGGKYAMCDTACEAYTSVLWHKKMGYKIYELESYHSTNYWSYVFVKPFECISKFSPLRIKVHYWKSYIIIKLTRNIDGSDKRLGVLYKKLKGI